MKVIILIMVMRMALLPKVSHADKVAQRKQVWPPVRSHQTHANVSSEGSGGTMALNKSSPASATAPLAHKPFGVTLISRDDWLAKEYFGYLCAPSECISERTKQSMRDKCFSPHEKLNVVLSKCFSSHSRLRCIAATEDASIDCVLRESKLDSQLIPLQLHDCVDQMITMKDWKCIRRTLINKLKSAMDLLASHQQLATSPSTGTEKASHSRVTSPSPPATSVDDTDTVEAISSLISSVTANASSMTNVTVFD